MNWRDQLKHIVGDLNVADDFIPNRETVEMAVLEKYSTEIIEKLIADIKNQVSTHTEHNGSYCDTGEDMEWACRSECVDMALDRINQLRDKWL